MSSLSADSDSSFHRWAQSDAKPGVFVFVHDDNFPTPNTTSGRSMPKSGKKIAVRGFQIRGDITVLEQSESQVVQRIFTRTNFFLIQQSAITKKFGDQISTSDKFIQSLRRLGYARHRPAASPSAEEKAGL